MRATNFRHYGSDTAKGEKVKVNSKSRKGVKIASAAFSFIIAAAALIVPTTTLAPGVDAYEDSRVASYSVGDIDKFASVIKDNCVEVTTAPVTEELTTIEETKAEKTTQAAKAEEKTEEVKEETKAEEKTEAVEIKEESSQAETSASKTEEQSQSSNDSSSNASVNYGSALISIANPDYSYTPSYVSLSSYDRAKLERLVYGEAGTMGFEGCALVAQSIRDTMNREGTSSIDRIINEYGYYGSTYSEANQTAKDAVSFIFDQNGMAVQHRVMVFYNTNMCYSAWHESQLFLTSVGGVRFFDMTY